MRVRKGLVGGTEPALLNLTDLDFLKKLGAFQLKFCEICKSYRQPFLRKKKKWGGTTCDAREFCPKNVDQISHPRAYNCLLINNTFGNACSLHPSILLYVHM